MVSNLLVPTGVEESKSSLLQPWLLITNGENCHIQNIMFNNKPVSHDVGSEIPGLLGRNIGCSCREWVYMADHCDGLPDVLVNLLSKETIELPLVDFGYNYCILTSTPSDPNCHIVYFTEEKNAVIFCQPGDKEFTIKKWDYEFFPDQLRATVDGKLFLNLYEKNSYCTMVMVEFKESTYHFEAIEMDADDRVIEFATTACPIYFEYSGELFIVRKITCGAYSENVARFKIVKADFLNKKWVHVKNLGRLALFIGGDRTAQVWCASVESGITANSIYFLQPDDFDNYYIYNLEKGTVRMKPTFSSVETTKHTELDWIMMPCPPKLLKVLFLQGGEESISHDSEKGNKAASGVEGVQNSSWNMVPPELLNLIQLHLFGRDHAMFRGVCKEWQQVCIRDYYSVPSLLLSSTTLLEQCESSSPLLMFQEDMSISYDSVPIFRFFDPVHRKLYRTGIPELREAHIHYSRDGWLMVSRGSDKSIFFFNPLTQEKIELPRLPSTSGFCPHTFSLSFSSPPTCSDCLVVAMGRFGTALYKLKHVDETWRDQDILEHGVDGLTTDAVREYVRDPVVINGLHYFMCENRDLVVFNLKDVVEGQYPDCQILSSKVKRPEGLSREDFLVEIDGGAAFVSVEPNGGEISVLKWNDLETDWKLMEGGVDFGGKEMFLSKRGWFVEKIDDGGGMGNTIFLPMIDDAKDGVFYSLATQRYHTFYSGYSSKLPYSVDKFLKGIWVKPDREIVGDKNLKWFV